jgi:magnesium transporter
MRIQAEKISSAFYLCGRWWKQIERKTFIKGLINYIDKTHISDIYIRKLNSVNVDTEDVEVRIMQNMI